jgi:hypothetical protein
MVPDASEMEFYSEGACELLAYALADHFGYEPVALRFYFPDGSYATPHVFALHGDVAIDAGGPTDVDEISARQWHVPKGANRERLVRLSPAEALGELRRWGEQDVEEALAYVAKYEDFYGPGSANAESKMYQDNPIDDAVAQAVVQYAHKYKLRPNMKSDEAKALIRAYLRAMGLREDQYGNFKDPEIPAERVHFKTQRVHHQQKTRGGWSSVNAYKPVDWARSIVRRSAEAAGDTDLAEKFAAGQKAAKKRGEAAKQRAVREKLKDQARKLAQKQFGMEHPDVAQRIGTGKLYTGPKFEEMKAQVDTLTEHWLDRIQQGEVPKDDSAFASIDRPPLMPVFFNGYDYDWVERIDGHEYSVHIQYGQPDTAIVTIGAHGQFAVDPATHRMFIPNYPLTGDAQVTGRVMWDGDELAGVLFMVTSLNKQKGAGTRVMQLWCRLMQGYGIEAWIAEAVGDEGMAFIKALERKKKLAVLGGTPANLIVGCLKPMLKKGPAPKRLAAPKPTSKPRRTKRPGPTSYLVEMMQWDKPKDGNQIEDRKQRVKRGDEAVRIALDFMKARLAPENAKVFITPMKGKMKLRQPAVALGARDGWYATNVAALEEAEQRTLHDGANELRKALSASRPARPDAPVLPEGMEGFDYFHNPIYRENPPWADKLLVKDWDKIRKVARKHKMPMPVREGQAKNFAELGCGHYGCVYGTKRDDVVFKLTSDPDEIRFIAAARKIGEWPDGIVRYYADMPLSGTFRKRPVQGIWREAAVKVGLTYPISVRTNDDVAVQKAWRLLSVFKDCASMVREYALKHPDKVRSMTPGREQEFDESMLRVERYEPPGAPPPIVKKAKYRRGAERAQYAIQACKFIGEVMVNVQVTYYIGEAMLFYMGHGILLADVHANNVGQVVREENYREPIWVITDPGHAVAIPPVWSYAADAQDQSALANPVQSDEAYSMGVDSRQAASMRDWAAQARKVGLKVKTVGSRGVATGTPAQWEKAKMLRPHVSLTWAWDEDRRGPATHEQVVRRSGVWLRKSSDILDEMILKIIAEIYANYERAKRGGFAGKEPCLSVGRMREEIEMRSPPDEYSFKTAKKRYAAIRSSLERLRSQGKIASSMGVGLRGKETRCYEPAMLLVQNNPTGGDWAYHVTFYNRLEAVADRGLLPVAGMHGSSMGKGGYAGHSQGKLFLTEEAGVPYWYGKGEDFANDASDNVLEEGYTPVVLRVPMPKSKKVDELGSRDSRQEAWYVKRAIKPDKIEVWTGQRWAPVGDWDEIDQAIAYDFEIPDESLMGIPEEVYLKADYNNPLVNFGPASPRKRIGL